MEPVRRTRVLVVANRTVATPRLLEAIERRAAEGPCEFALLIPDVTNRRTADWTLETAVRLMKRASQGKVVGLIGDADDPFESIRAVVRDGRFDEIIISTLPRRISRWLRRDLIQRVERLGLPVTAIVPTSTRLSAEEQMELGLGAGL